MYANFKVTCWEKVQISDIADGEKLLDLILEDKITSSNDIYDHLPNINLSYEFQVETEEQMTIEENDGQSTMEVYNDDGTLIYDNINGFNE